MPSPDSRRADPSRSYRPWLDGVRGVAVLLVVAEHAAADARVDWLPPGLGEMGVGLFFGLSGYLITGLLADEWRRTGRIRFGAFYARRAARLLPALVLALLGGCALLVWLHRDGVTGVAASVLLYVANYVTIIRGEYLTGFGQAWSLAVEEHFYLIWPVALVFMLRRCSLRAAAWWTVAVCLAALAWRGILVLGTGVTDLLPLHGSLERADALLYGCAAALAVRSGWRPRPWQMWVATALLVAGCLTTSTGVLGLTIVLALTGIATAALVVSLDHVDGPLRHLLSWRPLVGVGLISYGIYLWHWVLLIAFAQLHPDHPWGLVVVGFLVTPAVALVSYRLVEQPVRSRVRRWLAARDSDRGPTPSSTP